MKKNLPKTVKILIQDVVRTKQFKACQDRSFIRISQNTALERLDKDFVSAIPVDYEESFGNNAINACAFMSVTLAHFHSRI